MPAPTSLNLRSRRERLGLTVVELAAVADMSPWLRERIERLAPSLAVPGSTLPALDAVLPAVGVESSLPGVEAVIINDRRELAAKRADLDRRACVPFHVGPVPRHERALGEYAGAAS